MTFSLYVNLDAEEGVLGIVEPEAHHYLRENPWRWPGAKPAVSGLINQKLTATEMADQEENAVRVAEQMVRDAFRRMRAKGVGKSDGS